MTEKEISALKNTAKYEFYKEYVEPLEKSHDELVDEVERLERRIKRLEEELQGANKVKEAALNGDILQREKLENESIRATAQRLYEKNKLLEKELQHERANKRRN